MARPAAPGVRVERQVSRLFDGKVDDPMAVEMASWLASSTRFAAFVGTYGDKIRKKLRGASDAQARRDVRTELRVAALLLADPRIELAFEAYGSGRVGPDFSVGIRGERAFNLEVTRLRRSPAAVDHGGPLLTKLRQLPPSAPNALVIAIAGDTAEALDVEGSIRALRSRADRKDEAFFTARGFDGTRGFYERLLRLGVVVTWCEGAADQARAALFVNGSARIAVPTRAARACLDSLRA